jgi:16S rRNA (guanine(527)-N(7))-methyltransferase RsmG
MELGRISKLLAPFLEALEAHDTSVSSDRCHSEERSDEACPEPNRKPALSLPKGEPAVLSPSQLQSISTYIDILQRWNARINLTAIRDPEQIVTRHFGESLFAARHLFPRPAHVGTAAIGCPAEQSSASAVPSSAAEDCLGPAAARRKNAAHSLPRASRGGASGESNAAREPAPEGRGSLAVADVGSGPGFPGLPIKLWAPQISLTLIESNHKKATFLREVARALTLTDINIQTARAEDLLRQDQLKPSLVKRRLAESGLAQEVSEDSRQLFDVVTLRAVERFRDILPVAAALVAPGGRLALLLSLPQHGQALASLPTFQWLPPVRVPQSAKRILLTGTRESRE